MPNSTQHHERTDTHLAMSATLGQLRTAAPASTIETRPVPAKLDTAAIARHGIGRGDFAALVFSGSAAALGETIGMPTWATARRFALPDPRLADTDDLARSGACPFAPWPERTPRRHPASASSSPTTTIPASRR